MRVTTRWRMLAAIPITAALFAACQPVKPPPQSTPRDALVVGDSVGYSFGCVLGDRGGGPGSCPPPSGGAPLTVSNQFLGGCNISGGSVLLYSGIALNNFFCSDWRTSWSQLADQYQPKVVVIATSGFEIIDRWGTFPSSCNAGDARNCPIPPDQQWGGQECTPQQACPYANAAVYYSSALYQAIHLFLDRPWHPTVVVSNDIYVAPPEPLLPGTPVWYEPYPPTEPANWQAPSNTAGYVYRSSKTKIDQINTIIQGVKANYFAGNDKVVVFNFFKHFDPGGAFSEHICPPPNDAVAPNLNNQCPGGVSSIDARDTDLTHLTQTSPGGQDILAYYLVPCVRGLLGVGGGNVATCS